MTSVALTACHHGSPTSTPTGPAVRTGVTVMVLTPVPIGGRAITDTTLTTVETVLRQRFTAAHINLTHIRINSSSEIDITAGTVLTAAQVASLTAPAKLEFRAVLDSPTQDIPQPATGTATPPPGPQPGNAAELAAIKRKLGTAYTLAQSLTAPPAANDKATLSQLAPFYTLTADQVAALPANIQFNVPTVTCAQLNARNPSWITDDQFLGGQVVACDSQQPDVKYLLDAAKVQGTDVASASTVYDTTQYSGGDGSGWAVNLTFTGSGQQKWSTFTAAEVSNQVAITLDDRVISAPVIQSTINGPAVISGGGIDQTSATTLTNQFTSGSLPVTMQLTSVTTTPS